jgi:hypothetical protein
MNPIDSPFLVLALSFVLLFLSAYIGDLLRNRVIPLKEEGREDFSVVLSATLTLLALLIGFSFSMAVSRYDQRKNYEEAEANAIGTEYVRARSAIRRGCCRSPRATEEVRRSASAVLYDTQQREARENR